MDDRKGLYKIEKHTFGGETIINYVQLDNNNYDSYMQHLCNISYSYLSIVVVKWR